MESNAIKTSIKDKYLKVKELLGTKDLETAPYKSAYEAKELLDEMKDILQDYIGKGGQLDLRENAKLAGIYYLLGTIFMSTEETSSAEKHLLAAYYMVEGNSCHSENVLCATACLNQLGLLYARTLRNDDALRFLEKAVKIYISYTTNNATSNVEPLSFITMYADTPPKVEKNGTVILEKTYTLTLYYLAQVHTALEDKEKGAMYCHETLKRQIESNDYEKVEWAVNAATMSQVLIEKNAFKEARHHLAVSMLILDQCEQDVDSDESLKGTEMLEAK